MDHDLSVTKINFYEIGDASRYFCNIPFVVILPYTPILLLSIIILTEKFGRHFLSLLMGDMYIVLSVLLPLP